MHKYKTLVVKSTGEFGRLELIDEDNDLLFIGTSSAPNLYNKSVTLEDIKNEYKYSKIRLNSESNTLISFNWDDEIGDKWELVNCEVKINK